MNSRAVVVYAHPCHDSFVAAMRTATVDGLTRAGHEVTVLDLHRDGLDVRGPLPESHLDALAAADLLVIVYPTWWGGQPAILTGWLGLVADVSPPAAPRTRRVVAVTCHGSSKWMNRLAGRPGVHVLRRFAALACGPGARRDFLGLYRMDTAGAGARTAFLDRLTERLSAAR